MLRERNGQAPDERMIGLLVPTIGMTLKNQKAKGTVTDGGVLPKRWAMVK